MVSDIEFLETVCERMQQVGLVHSKADFSTRMLGKTPSYLTSMRSRNRKVPDEVMSSLVEQLLDGVACDNTALLALHEEAERREHDRKLRTDTLEWIAMHRATAESGDGKSYIGGKSKAVFLKLLPRFSFTLKAFPKGHSHHDTTRREGPWRLSFFLPQR